MLLAMLLTIILALSVRASGMAGGSTFSHGQEQHKVVMKQETLKASSSPACSVRQLTVD